MRGRISTSPTSAKSFSSCSRIRAPLQPVARMLHAIAVIMGVGAGAKLNFLDRDDYLLLFRLVCFLLRFILKLSEVDDLANRRLGVRRDLNQVHASFARSANCFT